MQARDQALANERETRERELADFGETLRTAQIGGVRFTLAGLFCVVVGTILGTLSVEITHLF